MKFINISIRYDILLFVIFSLVYFIYIENGLIINCICSIIILCFRNIYLLNGLYKIVIFLSVFFCFCFLFDFFFWFFMNLFCFFFCLCLYDSYLNVKFNDCNWFVLIIWFFIVFKILILLNIVWYEFIYCDELKIVVRMFDNI